ncbi:hypothetical protein PZ895_05880 [Mesorhizobium sp. YIM 152430]|uniref:hypothetical protein n=1 Tax=Mesorhizobium sp. YIM 152430 TaxID=3031761 RepID=UPI0023DC17F0|nr:hypothetical protein [Mesorhizobium sp. YIM 152430]MDF1599305.1 hypothetical protein [Mesorhizobium sp. YIM 152430]
MNGRRHRDRQAGFVLVEAVVALAIASLALLLMVTIGGMAAQGVGKGQARTEMLDALEAGTREVRRHIDAFAPVADFARPGGVLFEGRSDRLEFAAPTVAALTDIRHAIVQLAIVEDENGSALVRHTRALPDPTGAGGVDRDRPVILLQGPWRMRFFYMASPAQDWLDGWSAAAGLPNVVRLEIVDKASGARVTPPVVVPLRARAVLNCAETDGACKAVAAGTERSS